MTNLAQSQNLRPLFGPGLLTVNSLAGSLCIEQLWTS